LSDLLAVTGVRGTLISRAQVARPFGIASTGLPRPIFHTPTAGTAWIEVDGESHPLATGDVAILPHGHGHAIVDEPGSRCRSIRSFPFVREPGRLPVLVDGLDRVDTDLLCGSFALGEPAHTWLLGALPPLMIVRNSGRATRFVTATLELLEHEVAEGGLGARVVCDRLVEVLFVHLLRAWHEAHPGRASGWLAGLEDPQLARVITAVHAEPAGDWSIDRMCRLSGMSRTRFVQRFRDCMGTSPGTWATAWRIAVARRALQAGADVQRASTAAGYASEASFSRAFKRVMGVSPGAWRAASVGGASPAVVGG
jgi:AraC-like DNA-binding protein